MIIRRVHVDHFGVYAGQSLERLEPGLVVIRGANEAGKSTFVGFVRAVLFGFPKGNERARSYPLPAAGTPAGHLVLETRDGARYHVARSVGRRAAGEERVSPLDGAPAVTLGDLLGGVTREVFQNVFAFSLDELRDFRALDASQVRSVLYGASAGTGIQHLPAARRTLEDGARKLLTVDRKPIEAELARLAAKRDELHAALGRVGQYDRACEELQAVVEDIARSEGRLADLAARAGDLGVTLRLWEPWEHRRPHREAGAEIPETPEIPELPGDAADPAAGAAPDLRETDGGSAEPAAAEEVGREIAAFDRDLRDCVPGWSGERIAAFDASRARGALEPLLRESEGRERERLQASLGVEEAERALREAERERDRARWELSALEGAGDATRAELEGMQGALAELRGLVRERDAAEGAQQAQALRCEARRRDLQALDRRPDAPGGMIVAVTGLVLLAAGLVAGGGLLAVGQRGLAGGLGGVLAIVGSILLAVAVVQRRSAAEAAKEQRGRLETELTDLEHRRGQAAILLQTVDSRLAEAAGRAGMTGACTAAAVERHDAELRHRSTRVEARMLKAGERARCEERVLGRERDLAERRAALEEREAQGREALSRAADRLASMGLPPDWPPARAAATVGRLEALQQRFRRLAGRVARIRGLVAGLDAEQARLRVELDGRDEGEGRVAGLRDRKADLELRLQQMASSGDIGRLRAEEEAIKARLHDLGLEWSRYRVALHLVDEAWRRFERRAQPGVIRDAARFFGGITGGAYPEIFSPLSEEKKAFEVQARNGTRRTVEELSSGTQEQLYLSLRFGFLRHQAEVADPPPVIMDDILVNFDPARARRAAEAIGELARSVQVLFFTCHPATVEHFRAVLPGVRVVALDSGRFSEGG